MWKNVLNLLLDKLIWYLSLILLFFSGNNWCRTYHSFVTFRILSFRMYYPTFINTKFHLTVFVIWWLINMKSFSSMSQLSFTFAFGGLYFFFGWLVGWLVLVCGDFFFSIALLVNFISQKIVILLLSSFSGSFMNILNSIGPCETPLIIPTMVKPDHLFLLLFSHLSSIFFLSNFPTYKCSVSLNSVSEGCCRKHSESKHIVGIDTVSCCNALFFLLLPWQSTLQGSQFTSWV